MEKKPQGNVVFRRIGGRVIPIRLDKQKAKNAGSGAGMVAAGLGAAAIAGKVASKFHLEAAYAENAARNFKFSAQSFLKSGDGPGAKTLLKQSRSAASSAASLFRSGRVAKGLGALVGGTLIGTGVTKALSGTGVGNWLDQNEMAKNGLQVGVGSAAALGIRTGYTHGFGMMRGWNAVKHAFARVLVRGARL